MFEDGHLTYSLDEDPETIPQQVINMNSVEEVIDAEEVTGNQFSIGLKKGPHDALFIKGTSVKEKKWYVYPSIYPLLSSPIINLVLTTVVLRVGRIR